MAPSILCVILLAIPASVLATVPAVSVSVTNSTTLTRINAADRLVLTGDLRDVAPSMALTLMWDSPELGSLTPFALSPLNDTLVVSLRLATATPSTPYTFRLTATDASGASLSGSVVLSVNAGPTSGSVTPSPASGTELTTPFTLTTSGWTDPESDLPLTYQFSSQTSDSSSVVVPISAPTTSTSLSGVLLPRGGALDDTLSLFVVATDALGAASAPVSFDVSVAPTDASLNVTAAASFFSPSLLNTSYPLTTLTHVASLSALLVATADPCAGVVCSSTATSSCVAGVCVDPVLVDAVYGEWSSFSPCSASCGGGTSTRTRTCVAGSHGGTACTDPTSESVACNTAVCSGPAIAGGYSEWSAFGPCSVSCDGSMTGLFSGTFSRTRTCTNPAPSPSGATCTGLGAASETAACTKLCIPYVKPCPGSSVALKPDSTGDGIPVVECSGHGVCTRVPAATKCRAGLSSCFAACQCDAGYGGAGCEHPTSDLVSLQSLASDLVEAFVYAVRSASDGVASPSTTATTTAAAAAALIHLTASPDLLSDDDRAVLSTFVSTELLSDGVVFSGDVSVTTASNLLTAVGSIVTHDTYRSKTGLALSPATALTTAKSAEATATKVGAALLVGAVRGETAITLHTPAVSLTASRPLPGAVSVPVPDIGDHVVFPPTQFVDGVSVDAVTARWLSDPTAWNPNATPLTSGVVGVSLFESGSLTPVSVPQAPPVIVTLETNPGEKWKHYNCWRYDTAAEEWQRRGISLIGFKKSSDGRRILPICATLSVGTTFCGAPKMSFVKVNTVNPIQDVGELVNVFDPENMVPVVAMSVLIVLFVALFAASLRMERKQAKDLEALRAVHFMLWGTVVPGIGHDNVAALENRLNRPTTTGKAPPSSSSSSSGASTLSRYTVVQTSSATSSRPLAVLTMEYLLTAFVTRVRANHSWLSVLAPPASHQLVMPRSQRVAVLGMSIVVSMGFTALFLGTTASGMWQVAAAGALGAVVMMPFSLLFPFLFERVTAFSSWSLLRRHRLRKRAAQVEAQLHHRKGLLLAAAESSLQTVKDRLKRWTSVKASGNLGKASVKVAPAPATHAWVSPSSEDHQGLDGLDNSPPNSVRTNTTATTADSVARSPPSDDNAAAPVHITVAPATNTAASQAEEVAQAALKRLDKQLRQLDKVYNPLGLAVLLVGSALQAWTGMFAVVVAGYMLATGVAGAGSTSTLAGCGLAVGLTGGMGCWFARQERVPPTVALLLSSVLLEAASVAVLVATNATRTEFAFLTIGGMQAMGAAMAVIAAFALGVARRRMLRLRREELLLEIQLRKEATIKLEQDVDSHQRVDGAASKFAGLFRKHKVGVMATKKTELQVYHELSHLRRRLTLAVYLLLGVIVVLFLVINLLYAVQFSEAENANWMAGFAVANLTSFFINEPVIQAAKAVWELLVAARRRDLKEVVGGLPGGTLWDVRAAVKGRASGFQL